MMKKQNPALVYGLIGSAILIIFGIIVQMYIYSTLKKAVDTGGHFSAFTFLGISILTLCVAIAVYLFFIIKSIRDYRKVNPDYKYKQLVGHGLLATFIIAIVSTLFSLLYSTVIDPDSKGKIVEMSKQLVENTSSIPDDQKEKIIDSMNSQNQSPLRQATTGLAISLVFGLIISLIAGSVLNKRGKEFPTNPNNLS
jgi:hypothetical protein